MQPIIPWVSEVWFLPKKSSERKSIKFENKVLRKIVGPKYEAESRGGKKQRTERKIYINPDIIAVYNIYNK